MLGTGCVLMAALQEAVVAWVPHSLHTEAQGTDQICLGTQGRGGLHSGLSRVACSLERVISVHSCPGTSSPRAMSARRLLFPQEIWDLGAMVGPPPADSWKQSSLLKPPFLSGRQSQGSGPGSGPWGPVRLQAGGRVRFSCGT